MRVRLGATWGGDKNNFIDPARSRIYWGTPDDTEMSRLGILATTPYQIFDTELQWECYQVDLGGVYSERYAVQRWNNYL